MNELPKAYDPKLVEDVLTDKWQAAGLFKVEVKEGLTPYTMVIPPPNITGALHMGHGLNNTLQDALIRYHRMNGKNAAWVVGTDHGGIATQNVIEKKLAKEQKLTRHDLGREKFVEVVWDWYKECGNAIFNQFKKMGWAIDLTPENLRFTMDGPRAEAVYESFKRLWDKRYIYRGKRMINWCVRCSTALSDIEVEHEEQNSKLYHIHYPLADGSKGVVIATTRPETMFADAAVAVNPEDERYKDLLGKQLRLPLTDRLIPVIADEEVAKDFGTGALKITPAHDATDYNIGKKHNLETLTVISDKGKIINAPEKYNGMDREVARKETVKDLAELGFLVKEEKYKNAVSTCYRCHSHIEPYLSEQWFVKMDLLAELAVKAAEAGRVKFYPETWKGPFVNWLNNIQDWTISRQIWWGHRIPVWYCKKCSHGGLTFVTDKQGSEQVTKVSFEDGAKPILSHNKPEKCPDCGGSDLVQDPDVLDTWFSSALWPFSVFGWPKETPELKHFYPTSVLVTGYEIIYLWVARMVMTGLEFLGDVPFKDVLLNGIVRDKTGKKMSKSLGNVIDPLDMTAKYGTDAVRFSLLMQSVPGKDIPYAEESIVGARNFCNKIYNASRFILMNMQDVKGPLAMPSQFKELADEWIVGRYYKAIADARSGFEKYNLAYTSNALYHFLWGDFCDWYVELAKARFETDREYVMSILVNILYGTLKALHPVMPFITEQVSAALKPYVNAKEEFLLLEKYPEAQSAATFESAFKKMELLQGVIGAVRALRSQFNVSPAVKVNAVLAHEANDEEVAVYNEYASYIKTLAKVERLEVGKDEPRPHKSATLVVGTTAVHVPLEGLIDFEKERARLNKEIAAAKADIENRSARLKDSRFMTSAPAAQIAKTEAEYEAALKRLSEANTSLEGLG